MSVYVHDCNICEHRQDHHGGQGRSSCRCCNEKRPAELGDLHIHPEPRLWETFTHPGTRPEPLYQPGTQRNSGTVHKSDVCACDRCQELYAEAVGG